MKIKRKANKKDLKQAEYIFSMGNEYEKQGKIDDAINCYQRVIKLTPKFAGAYYNLGGVLVKKGRIDEAMTCYKKAIEITPNIAVTYNNLGNVLQDKGHLDEAIACYQKALDLNPNFTGAYYNLGDALQDKGQLNEAIICYQRAIELDPQFAYAYNNLATALKTKGQIAEAIIYCKKAIEIDPNLVNAICTLGSALQGKGQLDEALSHFRKAIELKSDSANAYYGLGITLKDLGKTDEAFIAFDKALMYQPNFLQARWAHCISHLRAIYKDKASIIDTRHRYHEELIKLRSMISFDSSQDIEALSEAVGSIQPFYLAAHGLNDKDLQKLYGELVCKIMALRYPEFAKQLPMPRSVQMEPLRIGFVSMFFHWHSVWKIPLSGWIQHLNKTKFNIYGYHTGRTTDRYTEIAQQHCKRFIEDIRSFETLCQTIHDDNLHLLIYPEIGMDPVSLKLASLRLAPIQCASLGHPDTSGLPTIDYYLSSELMEPSDGDDHYTEKLIRLPNLGFSYSPFEVRQVTLGRQDLGLKPHSVIYLCSHALFTHLPQYDFVYPKIAAQVNTCQFVFIAHKSNSTTEQFRLRIKEAFHRAGLQADTYVVMLPRLDQERYHALNCLSDVFLDTIGWSANNSTFEAISCNLPIVTLAGKLMRQRHCAGILSMVGVKETIASTLEEYIALAVKLGKDTARRRQISEKIAANKHLIYRDRTCIAALEDFLETIVKERLK